MAAMMTTYKLSQIDMSIKHGKLLSKNVLAVCRFVLIASLLMLFLIVVLMAIILIIRSLDAKEPALYLIAPAVISFAFAAFSLFFMVRNSKIKKKFMQCLEDGVEVKAKVREEDFMLVDTGFSKMDALTSSRGSRVFVKIRLDFKIEDKHYTRFSEYGRGKTKGHHPIFRKYVGRKINILYSHKYDEVLILKDE